MNSQWYVKSTAKMSLNWCQRLQHLFICRVYIYTSGWKNFYRLFEKLAFIGIMGNQLRAVLKPFYNLVLLSGDVSSIGTTRYWDASRSGCCTPDVVFQASNRCWRAAKLKQSIIYPRIEKLQWLGVKHPVGVWSLNRGISIEGLQCEI